LEKVLFITLALCRQPVHGPRVWTLPPYLSASTRRLNSLELDNRHDMASDSKTADGVDTTVSVHESPQVEDVPAPTASDNSSSAKWRTPALMVGLLVLATTTAIGHHFFYNYLNLKQVAYVSIPQTWVIRVGNGFAFLFKSLLVAAVGIAFYQRFWYSAGRESLQLQSVDAIFGVLKNPFKFFNADLVLRTKVLFILALIAWLLPITAIFAPGSLTGSTLSSASLMLVFNPQTIGTTTYNVPVLALGRDVGLFQTGSAQTFQGGSIGFKRFILGVFSTGQMGTWPSPCGSNCTYTISFPGPALSCVAGNPNGTNVPLLSADQIIYNATASYPGTPVNSTGANSTGGPFVGPSGFLVTVPANGTLAPNVINCTLYSATYQTTVQYTNNNATVGVQTTLGQIIPSSVEEALIDDIIPAGTNSSFNGTSIGDWWTLLNQYAVGYTFFDLLEGSLTFLPQGGYVVDKTSIIYTNLLNLAALSLTPDPTTLANQIESLFTNVTLSMLPYTASPIYIGAGFNTSDAPAATFTPIQATTTGYPTLYTYSPATLWEIYGVALGVTALCILVGIIAVLRNGGDGDASFLNILATTRNLVMDQMVEDEMGAAAVKKFQQSRVKFVKNQVKGHVKSQAGKAAGSAANGLFEFLSS
jgi:hypothetical protein